LGFIAFLLPEGEILAGQMLKEKCLLDGTDVSWEGKGAFFTLAN
jgi:hypothetical protein